ncbi:MAG: NYN domain-containing protein [Acidobacteria bacterium]|nr:NYN domain-containing protein [Acidobacteriota bacterium]
MRAYVYVDGLNPYYGALKGTSYKWLNLAELCRLLLPNDHIVQIKYYTAVVEARPDDPDAPTRQQFYLRALRTIPNLSIYFGHFLTQERSLPLVSPKAKGPKSARVYKTEEKGSDVNLATHLVRDGFRKEYDVAVVVTNDSDLLEPIRVVRRELGIPVGVLNPHPKPSRALLPHVTFIKQIRAGQLARSQFPEVLADSKGAFSKPTRWTKG